jgi:hypothetical protein
MKTLIGIIALTSASYLVAFPATAGTADDQQATSLINHVEGDEELTASEAAWQRTEFYTSFGGGE